MKKIVMGALVGLLTVGTLPLMAQDAGAGPAPKILQIFRESVKPGRAAAHEKVEVGWPAAFRAHKNSARYVAMTSITGPTEAWFVSGYDSYEAWEKQTNSEQSDPALQAELSRLSASDGDLLDNVRSITARFSEEMSHRPPINIGNYRYINVVTIRVRPGQQGKFVEMRKMIKAAHEKGGMKDYYSVFQVQSGMPGPAYMIFIPMKSLKDADEFPALHNSPAYKEALGGDEGDKKLTDLASASIINTESTIFAFNPKMSVPPPEFSAGADAAFWNPKPMASPKMKKTAAKE